MAALPAAATCVVAPRPGGGRVVSTAAATMITVTSDSSTRTNGSRSFSPARDDRRFRSANGIVAASSTDFTISDRP